MESSEPIGIKKKDGRKKALYKTELCLSAQETGICPYGQKCQFAHHESELRTLDRHPRYKTERCNTFFEKGTCPYGRRCCFIHTVNPALKPSLITALVQQTNQNEMNKIFNNLNLKILDDEEELISQKYQKQRSTSEPIAKNKLKLRTTSLEGLEELKSPLSPLLNHFGERLGLHDNLKPDTYSYDYSGSSIAAQYAYNDKFGSFHESVFGGESAQNDRQGQFGSFNEAANFKSLSGLDGFGSMGRQADQAFGSLPIHSHMDQPFGSLPRHAPADQAFGSLPRHAPADQAFGSIPRHAHMYQPFGSLPRHAPADQAFGSLPRHAPADQAFGSIPRLAPVDQAFGSLPRPEGTFGSLGRANDGSFGSLGRSNDFGSLGRNPIGNPLNRSYGQQYGRSFNEFQANSFGGRVQQEPLPMGEQPQSRKNKFINGKITTVDLKNSFNEPLSPLNPTGRSRRGFSDPWKGDESITPASSPVQGQASPFSPTHSIKKAEMLSPPNSPVSFARLFNDREE
jgi:hypothetical protein